MSKRKFVYLVNLFLVLVMMAVVACSGGEKKETANFGRARQLLAESRYGGPEGIGRVKLLISGSGSQPSIVLQGIVEMWRKNLGVEVELEQIDYATFLEEISKGRFQAFSLGWVADYPDPEDFLDLKFYWPRDRANNETAYNNSKVNELLERARIEQDPKERIKLYQEAEDIIVQDVPWILLFHGKESLLVKPYVKGFLPGPMGISTLQYVTLDESAPKPYLRLPGGEPLTLDPHRVTDVGSHAYVGKIFSGLLRLSPVVIDKNGKEVARDGNWSEEVIEKVRRGEYSLVARLAPDLAEAIPEPQRNSDGTVSYIFKIRQDARFQSGREVTAYDFAYSFERASDPRTRSTTAEMYLGDILGVRDMLRRRVPNRVSKDPNPEKVLVDLPGIEVVDRKTLKITIDAAKPYFLFKLTYPTAFVVDRIQVESVANWLERPNGTGPYKLIERDIGQIALEPNPYYHLHKARVSVVYYLTGGSSYPRYQAGELDMAAIGIADLKVLEEARNPNTELGRQYFQNIEMSTFYIGLNTKEKPFDDPKVRLAFALALDVESLAHEVLHDLVLPAYGILPPGMPGYRPEFKGIR
jgi:ABC-type transport system substrate-binding protein